MPPGFGQPQMLVMHCVNLQRKDGEDGSDIRETTWSRVNLKLSLHSRVELKKEVLSQDMLIS